MPLLVPVPLKGHTKSPEIGNIGQNNDSNNNNNNNNNNNYNKDRKSQNKYTSNVNFKQGILNRVRQNRERRINVAREEEKNNNNALVPLFAKFASSSSHEKNASPYHESTTDAMIPSEPLQKTELPSIPLLNTSPDEPPGLTSIVTPVENPTISVENQSLTYTTDHEDNSKHREQSLFVHSSPHASDIDNVSSYNNKSSDVTHTNKYKKKIKKLEKKITRYEKNDKIFRKNLDQMSREILAREFNVIELNSIIFDLNKDNLKLKTFHDNLLDNLSESHMDYDTLKENFVKEINNELDGGRPKGKKNAVNAVVETIYIDEPLPEEEQAKIDEIENNNNVVTRNNLRTLEIELNKRMNEYESLTTILQGKIDNAKDIPTDLTTFIESPYVQVLKNKIVSQNVTITDLQRTLDTRYAFWQTSMQKSKGLVQKMARAQKEEKENIHNYQQKVNAHVQGTVHQINILETNLRSSQQQVQTLQRQLQESMKNVNNNNSNGIIGYNNDINNNELEKMRKVCSSQQNSISILSSELLKTKERATELEKENRELRESVTSRDNTIGALNSTFTDLIESNNSVYKDHLHSLETRFNNMLEDIKGERVNKTELVCELQSIVNSGNGATTSLAFQRISSALHYIKKVNGRDKIPFSDIENAESLLNIVIRKMIDKETNLASLTKDDVTDDNSGFDGSARFRSNSISEFSGEKKTLPNAEPTQESAAKPTHTPTPGSANANRSTASTGIRGQIMMRVQPNATVSQSSREPQGKETHNEPGQVKGQQTSTETTPQASQVKPGELSNAQKTLQAMDNEPTLGGFPRRPPATSPQPNQEQTT